MHTNSITENGSITITVDKITEANAEKIRIQVADTGIGISEDGKELIFERFYRKHILLTILEVVSGYIL